MIFQNFKIIILLSLLLLGCQRQEQQYHEVSNKLIEQKIKMENLVGVFSNRCMSSSKTLDKGLLLYGEARAKQHLWINSIINELRMNSYGQTLDLQSTALIQKQEDFILSVEKFKTHALRSINQTCESQLRPMGRGLNLNFDIDLNGLVHFLYNAFTGNIHTKEMIEDLEAFKIRPFQELVMRKIQSGSIQLRE